MTHSGEYFLEPLLQANGEEYEEEHNKPHLVYKHDRKKSSPDNSDSKPCAASGKEWGPSRPKPTPAASIHCLQKPVGGRDFFHHFT